MLSEHRHRAHGQHQENPKAACDSATGIKDERYPGRIDAATDECDAAQVGPGEAPCDHQEHAGGEVGDASRQKGPGAARQQRLLAAQQLHREQHRRQEQPVEIDEADYAPGEIAPGELG